MRRLHPGFRVEPFGKSFDPGYRIHWKGRRVGQTQPLGALQTANDPQCYLVASGPSLSQLDLDRLAGKACFGVNGAIAAASGSPVSFRYHLVSDASFVRERLTLVRQMLESSADCLFSFGALNSLCEQDATLLAHDRLFLLPEINAFYNTPRLAPADFAAWAARQDYLTLHPDPQYHTGRVGFSRDIRRGVFSAQTVIFEALQVAAYLGYRQIFILGMDLNAGPGQARFYEQGDHVARTRLDRDYAPYIQPAFEVARNVAATAGFEVYNLSPESRLPAAIIPKITLDDALHMT
jgi:KDO transferase-3